MGTIAIELLNFKNAIDEKTYQMNNVCDEIEAAIKDFSELNSLYKNKVDLYYKSENKDIVLSSFDSSSKICIKIEKSITDTLRIMVANSNKIVDNVKQLEKINEDIKTQEDIINCNSGSDSVSVSRRNNANYEIDTKNIEFNRVHSETLNTLNILKNMDNAFLIEEFQNVDKNSNDIVVDGGIFKEQNFVSSNGVNVDYYIYVPNTKDSSVKLPILTYFHGIKDTVKRNEANNFKYGGGLAGLIETDEVEPKGIVIFPQADGTTKDSDFVTKVYEDAIIELIKDTANKYNGDLNRVSVAGHSNGGAAVQHIVNNNPGFFAAAAPISVSSNVKEGMLQTNVYALVGQNDDTMDGYGRAIGEAKRNNKMYKVYKGMGHDIQTIAFQEPVEDENGNSVMLVDWLMSKTLS